MDHIVNNIQLTQNLVCVLKAHRICNSTVRFSKYVVIFILRWKVVDLSYNKFCNILRAHRTCNSMVRFSKYVITFILRSKIVVLGYNKFCN